MKRKNFTLKLLAFVVITVFSQKVNAQLCEWRLGNKVYSAVDPDAGGPAVGSVQFTLQMHTTTSSITVTQISTGFSYQSAKAMVPTNPGCVTISAPANITLSTAFATAGFSYTSVAQCNVNSQNNGTFAFDRTASGTLDIGSIVINTTWVDVFTVTLWTLGPGVPEGGYAIINSTEFGTPGALSSYLISGPGGDYQANSLTFTNALPLGSAILPVLFTYFNANCNDKGTLLSWETATESNSDYFEIQKNIAGSWKVVDKVKAAGNSDIARQYQYLDLDGGNAQYRLRQVDLDNSSVLTDIRATSCEGKSFSTTLYPVPAKDKMTLVVRSDRAVTTTLQIMDAGGKMVKQLRTNINNGNTNIIIDVSSLAQGEYMLMSTEPTIRINKRFVIVR